MCVRSEKSIALTLAAGVTYPTTLNGCVRANGVGLRDAIGALGANAAEQPMSTSVRTTAPHVARTSRRISEARGLREKDAATLHDLADEFKVSAERIRQIEVKALQKMKGAMIPA